MRRVNRRRRRRATPICGASEKNIFVSRVFLHRSPVVSPLRRGARSMRHRAARRRWCDRARESRAGGRRARGDRQSRANALTAPRAPSPKGFAKNNFFSAPPKRRHESARRA
jgi:hypothetical protein